MLPVQNKTHQASKNNYREVHFQGRNNTTREIVEPRSCDHVRHKNNALTLLTTLLLC